MLGKSINFSNSRKRIKTKFDREVYVMKEFDKKYTEDIYTGWFRDKTAYVISADDLRSSLAMLVQSMEPSGRDNNYQVGLTCINYDDRYYKDDK